MLKNLIPFLPAEMAYQLSVKALLKESGADIAGGDHRLLGMPIPNRIGLAAGADRNGENLAAFSKLGFGFIEAGTVTQKPRSGTSGKRMWRVGNDALVHDLGLPSVGLEAFTANLAAFRETAGAQVACIGANVFSPDGRGEEMRNLGTTLYPHVDYFTMNAFCPNTNLIKSALSGHVREIKNLRYGAQDKPILIKLDPTRREEALDGMIEEFLGAGADGFIACNAVPATGHHLLGSSISSLSSDASQVAGSYSGPALAELSRWMVGYIRDRAPTAAIIGVGGIRSGADLAAMLAAGADAVQVWTSVARGGISVLDDLRRADGALPAQARPFAIAAE